MNSKLSEHLDDKPVENKVEGQEVTPDEVIEITDEEAKIGAPPEFEEVEKDAPPPPINVDPTGVLPPEVAAQVEQQLASGELGMGSEESSAAEQQRKMKEWFNKLTPKQKFKRGLQAEGYKMGITKPTLDARKQKNRKKNKQAKQSRKANR